MGAEGIFYRTSGCLGFELTGVLRLDVDFAWVNGCGESETILILDFIGHCIADRDLILFEACSKRLARGAFEISCERIKACP
jgi:hypothetical protein